VNHELVRPTDEDLTGKVTAQFTTEGALDGDGLKWKFFPARRHVAAAPLAGDHECLSA